MYYFALARFAHMYICLSLLFFFFCGPTTKKKKHVFSSPWVRKWCLLCVFLTLYQLEFKMKKKKKKRERQNGVFPSSLSGGERHGVGPASSWKSLLFGCMLQLLLYATPGSWRSPHSVLFFFSVWRDFYSLFFLLPLCSCSLFVVIVLKRGTATSSAPQQICGTLKLHEPIMKHMHI